ncbi:MAG: substrate-binding domain-containing protein [Ruminococcus sp.]|nr:substrate-binding domain-containing protein [Ruminococcus sp.]
MVDKPMIGIIVGRAYESVQKVMLEGIISQAEKYGFDTAVISNIHNFSYMSYFAYIEVENKIYELLESPRLDGIIVMAETLSDSDLRPAILKKINELNVPVVIAGESIEGYICVNNNIREDFREIARHLTDTHKFRRIDILTGQEEIPTSHERVQGVRDIMLQKNLPFDDTNIIYGNYWTNTGEDLADEYINGSRTMPEALICANDFMAYGFIDRMFEHGIKVGKDISVIGYEYVGERYYHSPVLSTFSRNRYNVGAKAVSILNNIITGEPVENISLKGCMVTGESCSCGSDKNSLMKELQMVRRVQFHNSMTMCGNFEHQLAMCRSLNDYIRALQDYSYLIRDIDGLYLCLYENWCSFNEISDLKKSSNDEMMTLYRIISPVEVSAEPHYFTRKMLFPDFLPGAGDKKYLYFVPMFSNGIEIGYFIFQYTKPDGYDAVAVGWINSAVTALNTLRMKNDINELLEHNNLSAFRDTATGMYNKDGFTREIQNMFKKAKKGESISAVLLKTRVFSDKNRIDEKGVSVKLDIETSECMKKLSLNKNVVCAKLSDNQFIFVSVGNHSENFHEKIADRLHNLIMHSPVYKSAGETANILTSGTTMYSLNTSLEELMLTLTDKMNRRTKDLSNLQKSQGFTEFNTIRTAMYKHPEKKWDAENECRDLHLSCGHFRAAYKSIFGISFHQDLIQSRISLAKYLLMTTSLSLPAIAAKCGYEDDKYFLRQFRQQTGTSPNAYRKFDLI